MDIVIGAFEPSPTLAHTLRMTFFVKAFAVRWTQCSATAELYARYFAGLSGCGDAERMRHPISYVLNELMENAIKFAAGDRVTLSCGVADDQLVIEVANHVAADAVAPLRQTLEGLVADDPFELMVQRVEANAEDADAETSGLGFLTMMTDYQVAFGWHIGDDPDATDLPLLRTLARLPIEE